MPIYRITFPNKTPVDVQGVSIRTEITQVSVPPAVPTTFTMWQVVPGRSNSAYVSFYSWTVPTIQDQGGGFVSGGYYWWYPRLIFTNPPGNTIVQNYSINAVNWYFTPGNTTIPRCDALITTATGNALRLQGTNGQPCPTWVTILDNECRPDEIKCTDLSDSRGFCCVPCDALNTKIRALI